jgi:hypothetical protein
VTIGAVGDLRNGNNHIHTDKNDICSLIIMFGANISGGNTLYYDGPNEKTPTAGRLGPS